ncbi:LPXTG cell wall anchor domain-containing protein [Aquihabitans sp. G128]|uniref:LPXTG cell wall anchor domain-containing protein n=1 Tax=Aquihabitans sp. G128 TaxID=2849779 RepID=UPI001C247EAA|nr:LPXTG cell wall anchor domain-containing protein [Aquihabitans sp. G128]QXC59957.1 LPXTG cell wall anchor domain-containing protein [Aquihabitans sp. G128]
MYRSIRPGAGVAVAGASTTAAVNATHLPVTGANVLVLLVVGLTLVALGFVLLRARLQAQASAR